MSAVEEVDPMLFDYPLCDEPALSGKYIWKCRAAKGHAADQHYMVQVGER